MRRSPNIRRTDHDLREVVTMRNGREVSCDLYKRDGSEKMLALYDRRPLWQRQLINDFHEAYLDKAIMMHGEREDLVRAQLIAWQGVPLRRRVRF